MARLRVRSDNFEIFVTAAAYVSLEVPFSRCKISGEE